MDEHLPAVDRARDEQTPGRAHCSHRHSDLRSRSSIVGLIVYGIFTTLDGPA